MFNRYIPYEPSPRQFEFLKLSCREAMYGGSAGCSKSSALLMAALQGVEIPGYSAILFRRTYSDLSLSGALMDRLASWLSRSKDVKWNNDDHCWSFPSGARVGFGYLDSKRDLDRYQSADFQFIGIDESTQFPEDWYLFLFSRLRRTKEFPSKFPMRFRTATNPGGLSHLFHVKRYGIVEGKEYPRGCKPIVTHDADGGARVFLPSHASDNPGLDWDDYRKSLAQLPEIRRMQLEKGIWVQESSGLVYHSASRVVKVPHLPDGFTWHKTLGVDIGATNNCGLAITASSPNLPESYLLWSKRPDGLNTPSALGKYIKDLNDLHDCSSIVGDHGALGKGYLEEFRMRFGIPIQNAEKQNKRGYIELFNGALETGMLRAVEGANDDWEKETSQLIWKDERRIEEMPGFANHVCDASLYSWRESRHYHSEPKEQERGIDQQEQIELEEIERSRETRARYGTVLPRWLKSSR